MVSALLIPLQNGGIHSLFKEASRAVSAIPHSFCCSVQYGHIMRPWSWAMIISRMYNYWLDFKGKHSVIPCRILPRQPSALSPCPIAPRQISRPGG